LQKKVIVQGYICVFAKNLVSMLKFFVHKKLDALDLSDKGIVIIFGTPQGEIFATLSLHFHL